MRKSILIIISLLGFISYSQTAAEYMNRGLEKYKSNDYKAAITEYDKAVAKDSSNALAYFYRGNSKFQLDYNSEAIKDFNMSIKLNPNDPEVYFYRGYTWLYMEKLEDALADLNKAITLNPSGRYYGLRGVIHDRLTHYAKAVDDLSISIKLNPNSAHSYFVLGYSNYNMYKRKEACTDWIVAIILGKEGADKIFKNLCK